MVVQGTYKNGTVQLDEKVNLTEGQRVTVELREFPAQQEEEPTVWQRLLELSGALNDGPTDASRNHDHYLYGAPKRPEASA
jgi:predicted DNA-binding antitoxin AbrB/MazE fold protein